MSMEYRSWIVVPDLAFSEEATHERLFDALLRDHIDLGPVMSWTRDGNATQIVLSIDADSQRAAATEMTNAVAEALRASGLGHLRALCSEITPVDEAAAAA